MNETLYTRKGVVVQKEQFPLAKDTLVVIELTNEDFVTRVIILEEDYNQHEAEIKKWLRKWKDEYAEFLDEFADELHQDIGIDFIMKTVDL